MAFRATWSLNAFQPMYAQIGAGAARFLSILHKRVTIVAILDSFCQGMFSLYLPL